MPVLIGVRAAFDMHARLKRQAPRLMQRTGLEWSFRLLTEPRRLARRYLTNNPRFAWRLFLQLSKAVRYDIRTGTRNN
jgi:N-acetylglucosaminyldiphosphoundecaprenol N-acetyl-beta-D-mannosaminyltransferase